ncbi:DNA polymerase III subunit delta' [Brevundimonas aveniformis]|uniref:DNA polymerase III subunit delta' n=1 Tax=Brevundimonas aveniformis TaxID=370977 RepID=UPI0003FF0294|nr:DNA polymerase III subunit delta' [Brevundimonas aveniformis]
MNDVVEGPRGQYHALKDERPEHAFLDALERGRLHHAWMLTGPEGLGKATFAYRAARRLLGARADRSLGLLGSDRTDRVSRLIEQDAHPDLLVLERRSEGGKLRKSISVEDARGLPEFFSKSPSMAEWRVAIIDAADDLNVNSANALLKTLEEPPERGVLFLVTHSPARLLVTIRSRCRRLPFKPWSAETVSALLETRLGIPPGDARSLALMAGGSPGRALQLADQGALEIDATARALVLGDAPDEAEMLRFADSMKGGEGQVRLELLFSRLAQAVRERAEVERPEAWGRVWDLIERTPAEAASLNLDRADVLFSTLAEIRKARA